MSGLHIHLFGGLLLESGGRILPTIPSKAGRSLFAYLVLNRERELGRDLVAGRFWPDVPDAQARRRLSQALWQIHTVLGGAGVDNYVVTTAASVRFNHAAPYWLDVEVFEAAADLAKGPPDAGPVRGEDLARLAEAAELYRGDLLAGFYDDWVLVEQQRLREKYYRTLAYLADLHKSRGEYDRALAYARRLALHDPLREEAHCEVMRLCFLAGRENEALQQYELCRAILWDELGAEPAAATTELFQSIRSHRQAGRRPFAPSVRSPLLDASSPIPLVGRDRPRAAVVAATERALAGAGGVVLIEGEPGVGKTRLLEAVAEDASWRGMGVLWGESREGGAARSYDPMAAALAAGLNQLRAEQLAAQLDGLWLGEVARLVPELEKWLPDLPGAAPLPPAEEGERMREAITRTLVGMGRISPQLLVLDDVQWADDDTLASLTHLADSLDSSRLVLCLAYRSEPARRRPQVWTTLRRLDRSVDTERIVLEPLSAAETGELIRRSSAAHVDADLVERLQRETGGNPLFVLETLRALHEHHVAAAGDGGGRLSVSGDFPLPSSVHEVISGRLSSLPAAAREVMNVFAVYGVDTPTEVAIQTADRPRPEFFQGLDLLVQRGILHERSGRYRFRHQQVQRVAYLEIGDAERRRLHHGVAATLEEMRPAEAELIAHHFVEAGSHAEAAAHSERAAERALARRAYATAAHHFRAARRAAAAIDAPPSERLRLLAGYEQVLDVLGRRRDQALVLDEMEVAAGRAGARQAAVGRRRALYLAHTDHFAEAEDAARRALEADRVEGRLADTVEDLIVLGMIGLWSGNAAEAVEHLQEAVVAGSEPAQLARARQALGRALASLQRYEAAAGAAAAALELFAAEEDFQGEAEALGLLGVVAMERGRVDESMDHYERAIELCRRIGYRHGEAVNLVNLGNAQWFVGRIADALESFNAASELFHRIGNRRGEAMVRANAASIHHGVLGDDATAARYCYGALEYFREIGDQGGEALVLCNLANIARRAGTLGDAQDYVANGLEAAARAGDRWVRAQLLSAQAQLQLELGRPGDAADTADRALQLCRELGLNDFTAGLLSIRGLAFLARGETAAAVESTAEAAKSINPGADQAHLIPLRHARALDAAGHPEEAARAVREAYELMMRRFQGLTDEQREAALAVPEHRDLVAAFQRVAPRGETVRLARTDAPTGRSLAEHERIDVTWTVAAPEDEAIDDDVARRRYRLRRMLEEAQAQGGAATVEDLAAALRAGVTTIRRDLRALREEGIVVSTRGSRQA